MTELLYYVDAYMKQFESRVIKTSEEGVVLDRTAFYPGGGGQPGDRGVLHREDKTAVVKNMKKGDGQIWHLLDIVPFKDGEGVLGEIDWEQRYKMMRTHTAMHILCGVIWRDYGASVTGGNMEPLRGRMDFEFETMKRELVDEIEEKINFEVEAAHQVRSKILPREEALIIPDLIRTKINLLPQGIREVRIVEIVGLDLQADGGTHVSNTKEVGKIKIVDYKSKGAINKRLVVSLDP
ncbi:MAG: Ala-tRNA(Pro) hydrolase [Chloroflexi bacterium RBG_16_48_8]|nr:MAG: Ala-tRNA(Pro) hydrolase [Chloroflexi bacterium RBG_16_48_8]